MARALLWCACMGAQPHRPSAPARPNGFTVIELMVVVAVVGILAAVAIPLLLRQLDNRPLEPPRSLAKAVAPAPDPRPTARPLPRSAKIEMRLRPESRLEGFGVVTGYRLVFKGRFTFENDSRLERVKLSFPFPPGTTSAWNATLSFVGRDGSAGQALGATFDRNGAHWTGPLRRGAKLTADVTYTVQGGDRLVFALAGARRAERLDVSVELEKVGTGAVTLPALQPTERTERRLVWRFRNLIAAQPIVIELPAAHSPLGRLMLLSKLVGLGLLFFGAGFWFLSEKHRPGRLRSFRWGHFLLLALNFALFFVLFAAVSFGDHISLSASLALAGALSLPLLGLHVGRIAGVRFALLHLLPLALLSYGVVLCGVYGQGWRLYGFVAVGLVAVGYVTVTYPGWTAGRKRHREREALASARRRGETTAAEAIHAAREALVETDPLADEADRLLGDAPPESAPSTVGWALRDETTRWLDARNELSSELEQARLLAAKLPEIADEEAHQRQAATLGHTARRHRERAARICAALNAAVAALRETSRRTPSPSLRQADAGLVHCLACGAGGSTTPYCAGCGEPRPRALRCAACEHTLLLPLHRLRRRDLQRTWHCPHCGDPTTPESATG